MGTPRASSTPRRSQRSDPLRCLRAALFAASVFLPLAVLYNAAALFRPSRPVVGPVRVPSPDEPIGNWPIDDDEVRLEKVLKEAAMGDSNTVILTTLNGPWASPNSVLDIFVESFRIGEGTRNLLDHLVMVALDNNAYERCISIHPYCFALRTEGVDFSGEQDFMSDGYLEMMWRRIDFLRVVLEMGYNFIFTDTDIMWFRNPMLHFYEDGDFQIACDLFVGNGSDLENRANGGFNYVKSNNRTIEFYKFWYSSKENHPGRHDQDVLNIIKYDPFIEELGLKLRFLSTTYFGGICESSKDFNKVCTMHANCCIGLSSKIHDLGVMLEDWRNFMSMPPALKRSMQLSWRIPQNCSLARVHD